MTLTNAVNVSVRLPKAVYDAIALKVENAEYLTPSDFVRQAVLLKLKNESA